MQIWVGGLFAVRPLIAVLALLTETRLEDEPATDSARRVDLQIRETPRQRGFDKSG